MNYNLFLFFISVLFSCEISNSENTQTQPLKESTFQSNNTIQTGGKTIATRLNPPAGFNRQQNNKNTFAFYLQNLPLKPEGSQVTYYNGAQKPNRNVYEAVVDLPIGTKDLHQCADAVIRLRAEYLYQQHRYDDIHFNYTNGFRADYNKWINGYRIQVNGNKVSWKKSSNPSSEYKSFWKYLENVFMYAGTASLEKELKPIPIQHAQIGDVFIKGGFPGHAVIIVDMAIHRTTGEKVFLLAQSYMPAQEIQVLKNNTSNNCWYSFKDNSINTPEWTFTSNQLKRFN